MLIQKQSALLNLYPRRSIFCPSSIQIVGRVIVLFVPSVYVQVFNPCRFGVLLIILSLFANLYPDIAQRRVGDYVHGDVAYDICWLILICHPFCPVYQWQFNVARFVCIGIILHLCAKKKGADVLSTPTHIIKNIPQKINLLIFLLLSETLRSLVRLSFLVSRCKYKTNSCTIGENFCQKMSYKLYNFVLFF